MALITLAGLISGGGMVWKYRRIPVRFYQWYKAEEVEPAEGQLWRAASFKPQDSDWKVVDVGEDGLNLISTTDKDDFDEFEEMDLEWEEWTDEFVGRRRFYCTDKNDNIHDTYWGDASEE